MGMDRARQQFDVQMATIGTGASSARPLPAPLQRLSTSERRTRFSDQTIETVRTAGTSGSGRVVPTISMSPPRLTMPAPPHTPGGPAGSQSLPGNSARPWSPHLSPPTVSAPSPYLVIDPQRTDYFQTVTRDRKSWRAFINLSGVMAGRVLITFGTGGLVSGFAPKRGLGPGLRPHAEPVDAVNTIVHHVATGATLTALGTAMAGVAIASFVSDTYRLGRRRSLFIGSVSYLGLTCLLAASLLYVYGQSEDSIKVRYASLVPRTVGNFCMFYAVTNSFPSSELVHGNVPLPNREQFRLIAFATGGAFMVLWGYLNSPSQNAPLWTREVCSSIGLAGLHSGASLSRTDAIRFQSENRTLRSPSPAVSPRA
ncbi:MAG: hypothetical protein EOO40_00515 [Deltaproteobacteria bacterium]|nr:MAG: hypothetical protein EOO40_00515 [Deltaproteobacteria bacterium]